MQKILIDENLSPSLASDAQQKGFLCSHVNHLGKTGTKDWELTYGILDQTAPRGEHLGCVELLKAVKAKKPRIHIFGHIHGGAGTYENADTQFINAAYLDEQYRAAEPAGIIRVVNL